MKLYDETMEDYSRTKIHSSELKIICHTNMWQIFLVVPETKNT